MPRSRLSSLPRHLATESASGVGQMLCMHYFDEVDSTAHRTGKKNGEVERRTVSYFYVLPTLEQHAALLAATEMRAAVRAEARADLAEQHYYLKTQARAGIGMPTGQAHCRAPQDNGCVRPL
eukprot:6174776-Pleurochrysis_carterae.AAC.2